ncbi:kinesin-14 [Tieghemostelium lacteum]|uniref:Kinesin-14 n=1 Tax=Tieghemostelium lacteum TaxID=361077 RepID=A0A152A6M2_TIELA|nr:kinesin-14 [Tieghemostelium lacteum]|eukprot:KYR01864.1 kinesin-14 [Tieghemostelium lacteum]
MSTFGRDILNTSTQSNRESLIRKPKSVPTDVSEPRYSLPSSLQNSTNSNIFSNSTNKNFNGSVNSKSNFNSTVSPTTSNSSNGSNGSSTATRNIVVSKARQHQQQIQLQNNTKGRENTIVNKTPINKPKDDLKKTSTTTQSIRQQVNAIKQQQHLDNRSISKPSLQFQKSNIFSTLSTLNPSSSLLKDGLSRIQQYTQSFSQSIIPTEIGINSIVPEFKAPRFSLSPNDIRTSLDVEEKEKTINQLKIEISKLNNSLSQGKVDLVNYQMQLRDMTSNNQQLSEQLTIYQNQVTELNNRIVELSTNYSQYDQVIGRLNETNQALESRLSEFEMALHSKDNEIADLQEKSRKDEALRKKLHNTIQELKGNIRVFCRVRPNKDNGDQVVIEYPMNTDNQLELSVPTNPTVNSYNMMSSVNGSIPQNVKKLNFQFDRVFGVGSSQEIVFEEISQLVQCSLDGFNTCIFSYGATGAGKTYTMEGGQTPDSRGMIPRTVEKIFQSAKELESKGWQYTMDAFYLEIYNEQINDLLNLKPDPNVKYEIKHLDTSTTQVTNLNVVTVRHPKEVFQLLSLASKTRSVAKTNCNERSSRSHSVFQLKIQGLNSYTKESSQGILNLIDLAGSERLSKSGAQGDRLKETQSINKSLSSLSDVIAALANKDPHVPYRNSKLTYLLQNSLGGNSKTLMFVNVSPESKDSNETLSSLRFATKVNNCEIGPARKQLKVDMN